MLGIMYEEAMHDFNVAGIFIEQYPSDCIFLLLLGAAWAIKAIGAARSRRGRNYWDRFRHCCDSIRGADKNSIKTRKDKTRAAKTKLASCRSPAPQT